jgi:O-antigen/teichoic acid export membrane protein
MSLSNPRKLVLNFAFLSGSEALSKVLGFFAFAYLARMLGPSSYGMIEFALAITLWFNVAVEGGLGLLGAREIAKDPTSLKKLTSHIVVIRFLIALIAFLLLVAFTFVALHHTPPLQRDIVLLYGLTLFCTPALIPWVFQGLDRMRWVAIFSLTRWFFFAAAVIIFVQYQEKIWMVPLAELVALSATAILNYIVFVRAFGPPERAMDISFGVSLIRQALPIGITQIMWGLRIYLPTVLLGLLVGGEQVGWFGGAHRIVISIHTFVWMYFFNLYPSLSRSTNQSVQDLEKLVGKSLQLVLWPAVFLSVTGTLLGEQIMGFVYGSSYIEAARSFEILIWLIFVVLISGHFMYILIAYNRQWLELLSACCGAFLSLLLCLLLIPFHGFLGAALAVICSEIVILVVSFLFVSRVIIAISFWRHIIRPSIAGISVAVFSHFMPEAGLWVTIGVSVFVFGAGLFLLQPGFLGDLRIVLPAERKE